MTTPDTGPRSTHGLLGVVLAALPGMRRRREARLPTVVPAPVVPVEGPMAPPAEEETGWPTWRGPR
jgi:MYXO-CTERM domain-containing protein